MSKTTKLARTVSRQTSPEANLQRQYLHPRGNDSKQEEQDGEIRHGNDNFEEGIATKGSSSVFGIGASREFICISCGDDFDCEDDLACHQNECDESAKIVGSTSGDGLRGGGSGGKKFISEGRDDTESNENDERLEMNEDNGNSLKGNVEELGKVAENGFQDEEGRCEDLSSNKNDRTVENVVSLCNGQSEKESNGTDDGKRLARKRCLNVNDADKQETTEAVVVEEKAATGVKKCKVGKDEAGNGGAEREEENNCTNDDNNNDINSSDEGVGTDDNTLDLKNSHTLMTNGPGTFPHVENHGSSYKENNDISPDISQSSLPITENHCQTQKLSPLYRWQEKNRYASSLVNLTSQGSSLRPQHKCQLCGKAFWKTKHLSQHWIMEHGIQCKNVEDDGNQETHKSGKTNELKLSPSKEIQTDFMTLSSQWPFSNHLRHSSLDSDFAFKSNPNLTGQNGSESMKSSNRNFKSTFHGDLDNRLLGDSVRDSRNKLDRSLRDDILPSRDQKLENSLESSKESNQGFHQMETLSNSNNLTQKNGKDKPEFNEPSPPRTFTLPGQSLAPSDLLTDYINQYHKLAQWLSQGANFCPTCLVYHTNENPCPVTLERQCRTAVKTEKKEEGDDEEKEVNVDGEEEATEDVPLDMSKTSLDLSANALSSSCPSSMSSHFLPSLPSSLDMPAYYNYAHYMQANSILDMSTAAAMKAASTGDIPTLSQNQDVSSALSGSSLFGRGEGAFTSYHPFPPSIATGVNTLKKVSSPQNDLGSSQAASNNGNSINNNSDNKSSSSSPSSSSFSFLSASANMSAASLASQSVGGKKKSTPQKQGFVCTVCNRVYSHQSALFTHMRSHSPSSRSYRCQFCNETFARAPDLKVHVCPNGIEKPFTCPSCGQTFAKNIHLKRHLATHSGLKPYPCWICGKRFSRSDHLKRHTQSIHAGARPHACHICGKEFVRKYELNKHMSSHNP